MEIRLPTIEELKEKMQRNPDEFTIGTIYWTSEEHNAPQYKEDFAYGILFDPDNNIEHLEYSYSKNTPYDNEQDKATSKYIVVNENGEECDLEWMDATNVSISLGGVSWNDSINEINHFSSEH